MNEVEEYVKKRIEEQIRLVQEQIYTGYIMLRIGSGLRVIKPIGEIDTRSYN